MKKYQFNVGSEYIYIYYSELNIYFQKISYKYKLGNEIMFLVLYEVEVKDVSRLCHAKPIVMVNGIFPGAYNLC